jgi:small conductance mechanosensitive channel
MQVPPAVPPVSAVPANALEITLALALALTIAAAAALAIGRIARRLFNIVGREELAAEPLVKRTLRVARWLTFVVVFLALAFPALDWAGVRQGAGLQSEDLVYWASRTGLRIIALLLMAFVIVRLVTAVVVRAERDLDVGSGLDALERRKRAQTIASLARRTLSGLIWTCAVLIVLRELDVDITPVLAGAGIVGLAIGFGAQTLVRDVITGFFLIVEDQVRVGDVAVVNGTGGLVEQINLRTIVLRDLEGVVHVIPNGEIKTLANRTKDFAYYVIDLGIEYEADIDQVTSLVKEAGRDLQADPAFAPSILEPVEVLGVDAFNESSVTLKVRIKTVPLKQWEVGRELRRRLKKVMDQHGIRIPYPQLQIHVTRHREPEMAGQRNVKEGSA